MRLRRQLEHDDVGILTGGLSELAQDLDPVRLVAARARQDEPHVVVLLHHAVGVHDADRVVTRRERPDLHQQRLAPDHAERRQDVRELACRQLAVLLGQRVDGRLNDVHRDPEPALEPRQ